MDMYPVAVPLNAHASIVRVHIYIVCVPYSENYTCMYCSSGGCVGSMKPPQIAVGVVCAMLFMSVCVYGNM